MIRFLQLLIVLSWLGTTGWLAWTVYAPAGAGFEEMDPQEARDSFFEWGETTSMTILENGRRIGQVNVSGSAGPDRRGERGFLKTLSMAGSLDDDEISKNPGAIGLFWRMVLEFDESQPMEIVGGEFSLRVPSRELSTHIEMAGNPPVMRARAVLNGVKLLEYDGDPDSIPDVPGALTQSLGGFGMLGDLLSADSFQPEVTAKRGTREFGGREMPVYLLELSPGEDQPVARIFLSTAGEPLKVETDLGIEAISEVLVPLDAFQ